MSLKFEPQIQKTDVSGKNRFLHHLKGPVLTWCIFHASEYFLLHRRYGFFRLLIGYEFFHTEHEHHAAKKKKLLLFLFYFFCIEVNFRHIHTADKSINQSRWLCWTDVWPVFLNKQHQQQWLMSSLCVSLTQMRQWASIKEPWTVPSTS